MGRERMQGEGAAQLSMKAVTLVKGGLRSNSSPCTKALNDLRQVCSPHRTLLSVFHLQNEVLNFMVPQKLFYF